jgi:hypothetical protein
VERARSTIDRIVLRQDLVWDHDRHRQALERFERRASLSKVVICHPKLVETGLDLLDFPTIIFYESGYSLHTLRQARRRSWRIGQRRPVRVMLLCCEGTMQTSCLRLMGKKLLVALTMEGKFAGEGLQSIDEDDDMLSAMAREPVERNGIGDTADSVWRALSTEHQKLFPANSHGDDGASSIEIPGTLLDTPSALASIVERAVDPASIVIFRTATAIVRKKTAS